MYTYKPITIMHIIYILNMHDCERLYIHVDFFFKIYNRFQRTIVKPICDLGVMNDPAGD